jgi:polar amino acid transport system substrate-binding protein
VDLVISAMTINCARWQQIAFSAEYYRAGQKVLVPMDSKATSLDYLGGQRVCASAGSTSLDKLKTFPYVKVVTAATHTGCLVKFQQGQADAITGDDAVLARLAAQDPYAKVVGDPFTSEPHGIGAPPAPRTWSGTSTPFSPRRSRTAPGKPRTTAGWRPRSARHQHRPPRSTDADADLHS